MTADSRLYAVTQYGRVALLNVT